MTLVSGSALTDIFYNKIYNAWILPGMLVGLGMSIHNGGTDGLFAALISVAMSLAILIPVYMVKGIGAGDVKLLAAVASFLSAQDSIRCIICSFLIGGVISLSVILVHRSMKQTIHFAVPILIALILYQGGYL